jgi:hypothetical protein
MQVPAGEAKLPIWGGVEATIVRLGNEWRDQVQETGHCLRLDDLDRIAALGLSALRYPVLWESVAPNHPEERDWSWHNQRLGRLRALGFRLLRGCSTTAAVRATPICSTSSSPRSSPPMPSPSQRATPG